jgi:hypothetical protein
MKVAQPPPNRVKRPRIENIGQARWFERRLLLWRPNDGRRDRDRVVERENGIRESIVVRRRAPAYVYRNVAEVEGLDLVAPAAYVLLHGRIVANVLLQCRAKRMLDASDCLLLHCPGRVVRRVRVRVKLHAPRGRDAAWHCRPSVLMFS